MITQERLKGLLSYDAETGIFTWISRRIGVKKGSVAGGYNGKGYWLIYVDGYRYRAHRLAWLYMYGKMPEDQIDHINHDKIDNRISNLREVTNSVNHRNMKKPSNNTSGVAGLYWWDDRQVWQTFIGSRPRKSLGNYKDFFEAACARKSAERKLNYHINHGK
jgi:hypothetical protein